MSFCVELLEVAVKGIIGAVCRTGVDRLSKSVWQNGDGTLDGRCSEEDKAKHPTKKDGTLDMRWKINWGLKK